MRSQAGAGHKGAGAVGHSWNCAGLSPFEVGFQASAFQNFSGAWGAELEVAIV